MLRPPIDFRRLYPISVANVKNLNDNEPAGSSFYLFSFWHDDFLRRYDNHLAWNQADYEHEVEQET